MKHSHRHTRRDFLKTPGAVVLGTGMGLSATYDQRVAADDSSTDDLNTVEPAKLAMLREQGRRRRRRIIFNNDGGDVAQFTAPTSVSETVETFLSQRNKQVLGTQVDSIFYSTTTTIMGTYPSDVSETSGEFGGDYAGNIAALKAAGHDCLTATVGFCHANKLEMFWSHRMNDIHDSFIDSLFCRFKREHPEYLLGTQEEAVQSAAMLGRKEGIWLADNKIAFPVTVTLLSPVPVRCDTLTLAQSDWHSGDYRTKDFAVAFSADGKDFYQVARGTLPNTAAAPIETKLPDQKFVALRIRILNTHDRQVAISCGLKSLRLYSGGQRIDLKDWTAIASSSYAGFDASSLLGGEAARRASRPIRRFWSALNYAKPAVRDYLCRIQQDVCSRYDIDGVECDYYRTPMFFRTIMDGQPATPAETEILTGFQRRLRQIHLREGTKRGHPILTAARVPTTPATCRYVGIDIRRWIKDRLIDVLTVSGGYLPFTEPIDEIVKLAHDAGIPVYPTISSSGMGGGYGTLEGWRGAAANMLHAGANGINTFNLFPSGPEPRWKDLGSQATLAGRNKLFVIEPSLVYQKGDLIGDAITQPSPLPLTIPGDGKAAFTKLPIGDDLPAAGKKGTLKSADLRIQLSNPQATHVMEVRLNGALLTPVVQASQTGWLVFQPRAEQYRLGLNELTFLAADPSPKAKSLGEVTRVEVPVIYQ
ncbi:MAG: discoidin domain-containing protein [Pirellulales bacterium]